MILLLLLLLLDMLCCYIKVDDNERKSTLYLYLFKMLSLARRGNLLAMQF